MKRFGFTREELGKCYKFAQDMRGNHHPDMIMERKDWEIFRDDFRGKLGEIAFYNYIKQHMPHLPVQRGLDFSVTPRGQWDITDLEIGGLFINVKSVKQRSYFLMVEQKRYQEDGTFAYKNNDGSSVRVDAYVLVRVTIEPDLAWMDMNDKDINELVRPAGRERMIYAQVLGGISHGDFWREKHSAPKGIRCSRESLDLICRGWGPVLEPEGQYKKNEILQQDNYVLSCDELISIEELFLPGGNKNT